MGSKGCILFSNNKKTKFDTYNVEALKPTGAGDAFLAGFCASYVDESTQNDAILKGAATAAIVVSKVGCSASIPSITELKKFMETHKKPTLYKD
jgi:5-dehydro-2-deoxygluconokinase